ncbi:uncharacterized protein [Euwallacea similis]|uniref:uncharacterized protein n=1 Tax=Euwallacea similis TaxID=1736056 RepID=UPI00344D9491
MTYRQVHQVPRRIFTLIIFLFVTVFILFSYINLYNIKVFEVGSLNFPVYVQLTSRNKYLINTTGCKIPKLDALNEDVFPFVHKEQYVSCSNKGLLTYIEYSTSPPKLMINQSLAKLYSYMSITCCYSYIYRKDGDKWVSYSSCENFLTEVDIFHPYVYVICRNTIFLNVYENSHFVIIKSSYKYINEDSASKTKWRIFALGIDSMSLLNFQRTMPKSYQHLEDNFLSFKGYNKIEDNTFPNLMAIFTGRSMDTLEPDCLRNQTFDRCDFIWRYFKQSGYITALGEDEPQINTFNYLKDGFLEPPTDIYLRPYLLAAYNLWKTSKSHRAICTGPENSAQRIFNAGKDFLDIFPNNPIFSFYWTNSFSHDNVNLPSSMDDTFYEFLTDPIVEGSMDNTILIFFSDHGFRFGDIRFTYSGWLEERLPFMYFKFPNTFKDSYPSFIENFKINAKSRLTTPYDVHMTLQHILKLSDDSYVIKPSLGCPKCKSLFNLIEDNRTCEDAAIEQHYCTCGGYQRVPVDTSEVRHVANYIVSEINRLIIDFKEGNKCANYFLTSIVSASVSNSVSKDQIGGFPVYLVLVQTYPYAMFEATVKVKNGEMTLLGQISRLNKYKEFSECVNNDILRKYCFCDTLIKRILSKFCTWAECPMWW